jgi:hypothetical protein
MCPPSKAGRRLRIICLFAWVLLGCFVELSVPVWRFWIKGLPKATTAGQTEKIPAEMLASYGHIKAFTHTTRKPW